VKCHDAQKEWRRRVNPWPPIEKEATGRFTSENVFLTVER